MDHAGLKLGTTQPRLHNSANGSISRGWLHSRYGAADGTESVSSPKLDAERPQAVVVSGHMVDRPGRHLLRGADIIAAEAALERGVAVRLVLAREPGDFVSDSVSLPQRDWEERFRALVGQADVEIVGGSDDDVHARTNERIIERACEVDDHPLALIVWNGEEGDGPGGTSDFVARLGRVSGEDRVVVIDPIPQPSSTD
jgi:hypothetical protein